MGLDNHQKNYIKRNLKHYPVSKIAGDLGIPENEVLDYLKKKWSPEKYSKFLRNRFEVESVLHQATATFSFSNFVRENRLTIGILFALVFVSYANSFFNGFVSDDVGGFARNENIGRLSSVFAGNLHFSVQSLFSFIAFHIGGLHPFSFRIFNILTHLGSVIVIYIILSLSTKKRVAAIAAALFAVHPILVESVTWISGGIYSYYAFFFLLSFLFYLLSKNNKKYFYYSVVFYIFSLFCSEKALILFLIFPLYEFVFGNLRQNWKKTIPYFTIGFFWALLFVSKIGMRVSAVEAQGYQQSSGFWNPLVQVPVALANYLGLIFWPAKLTLYHTEMSFTKGKFLIMLSAFFLLAGTIIFGYRKNKAIFFWLTFFVITLLPTLTPFKISWIVAERYVYLGSLGIFVVIAIFFDRLSRFNENAKMVTFAAIGIILTALSIRTIVRNIDWKNEDNLWIATAKVSPSGQVIHNNLGDVYSRQKNYAKSIEEFKKAIEINPNYADAYHNLGNTYQQVGQEDLAVENYQKALSINPNLWQSHQNLAGIYFNKGDHQKALENIKKALEIDPTNEKLKQNLNIIESQMK